MKPPSTAPHRAGPATSLLRRNRRCRRCLRSSTAATSASRSCSTANCFRHCLFRPAPLERRTRLPQHVSRGFNRIGRSSRYTTQTLPAAQGLATVSVVELVDQRAESMRGAMHSAHAPAASLLRGSVITDATGRTAAHAGNGGSARARRWPPPRAVSSCAARGLRCQRRPRTSTESLRRTPAAGTSIAEMILPMRARLSA